MRHPFLIFNQYLASKLLEFQVRKVALQSLYVLNSLENHVKTQRKTRQETLVIYKNFFQKVLLNSLKLYHGHKNYKSHILTNDLFNVHNVGKICLHQLQQIFYFLFLHNCGDLRKQHNIDCIQETSCKTLFVVRIC